MKIMAEIAISRKKKKIEIFCECKIELFDGNTNETQGTCMKSITDEKP